MGKEKRNHSSEFKARIALEAIRGRFSVNELAETYDLHPSLVHFWKKTLMDAVPAVMAKNGKGAAAADREIAKANEKELRRLRQENEWLQTILQRLSPSERRGAVEFDNPNIPLIRQVKILNVNRSSLYYKRKSPDAKQVEPA